MRWGRRRHLKNGLDGGHRKLRAHPPLCERRQDGIGPGPQATCAGARDIVADFSPKAVPSRHIANNTPASFRPRATMAMRWPRRWAMTWVQRLSSSVLGWRERMTDHAASIRNHLSRVLPVLVIAPRFWRS